MESAPALPRPRPALRAGAPVAVTLALAAIALAWDASGLDLPFMRALGDARGFPLRGSWWLETVMHDGARRLALAAFVLLAFLAWRPAGPMRLFGGRERAQMVAGTLLALAFTGLAKRASLSSCPWDLADFGGIATYVSHWQWGVADGGPGACFPGGHASAALAFVALATPGLVAPAGSPKRRFAWLALAASLGGGLALGFAQTLRGAHFPSHTLWSALACWGAAWASHALLVGRK